MPAAPTTTAHAEAVTYRHFEVVEEDGKVARTNPLPGEVTPQWAKEVSQEPFDWSAQQVGDEPIFKPVIPFVLPPAEGSNEPFYNHNHQPDITWLPNGDLLAIWYTTRAEHGTELTVLASRLRAGAEQWDPSSEFFRAADRNMHGSAIFHDGQGTIHHFNGMGREGATGWHTLAMLYRSSRDNGVTWTAARPASTGAVYRNQHQVSAGMIRTKDGALIVVCDAAATGEGEGATSALHISRDDGATWTDPGGTIRGIHAGIEQLADGRLFVLGRRGASDAFIPISMSDDMGRSWSFEDSPFPPVGGGQRLVLIRLREGPLMLVSFTETGRHAGRNPTRGMTFTDSAGETFTGYGLYVALSDDDGRTWPHRKLITPGEGEWDGGAWTGRFTATPTRGEHAGYLAATQTPDGMIHLISSRLHYRFNLAWLHHPN